MKAKAGGLILFSFAFSSVFSSPEILASTKGIDGVKTLENTRGFPRPSNVSSEASKRDHEVEKREVEIYNGGDVSSKSGGGSTSSSDGGGLDPETMGRKLSSEESLLNSKLFAGRGEDLYKRNRMRFTGMRGKKEYPQDRPCREIETENGDSTISKRTLRNYKEFLGDKRAPLAFHGMRGKKSEEEEVEGEEEQDQENQWGEPEVQRLRITLPRERFLLLDSGLFDTGNGIPEVDYPEPEELPSKRSPYSFQGMRGKKTTGYDLKRAMGFLGMRGKKEPEVWISDYYKRAPQSSFFGMKGKKAQSGFFGMRGKKSSLATSFDSKGIGKPFDFDLEEENSLDGIKERESTKNRFRRETNWSNVNEKKTKVGFFGVGGEKHSPSETSSAHK